MARPQLLPATLLQLGVKHSMRSWYRPASAAVTRPCTMVAFRPTYMRTAGDDGSNCCEKAAHTWNVPIATSVVVGMGAIWSKKALEPT